VTSSDLSGTDALLQFRFASNGTAETLYVRGELDISSAPSFERAAADALDGQGGAFHVDLSGLTFMDSTGARSLVRVHERVGRIGRDLVVVRPTRPVRLVLELLGLDQVITVEP
jgi:anti-anti-sigma factor